jgi:hypothetical protein
MVGVRLAFVDLQIIAPALEAALAVYTRLGRPLTERMPLLTSLAQAGYYVERFWGERYADQALSVIQELSGLKLAARLRPYLGRTFSLLVGLARAWLRFALMPRRDLKYTFTDVMTQLFGVVTTMAGSAAIALDVPRAASVAAVLEPFRGLPRRLTPTGIAEYCASLMEIGRENQAVALTMWCELQKRFGDSHYYIALPRPARPLYTGGLWFARGVFESFRDGQGALEAADALDRLGLKLYSMIASALRSIHFSNRGDLAQARLHREQVDVHAIQVGSAWQIELWEPAALILVYTQIGDVTEMVRVADRLEALAQTYPSLTLYAQLSRMALTVTRENDGGLLIDSQIPHVAMHNTVDRIIAMLHTEPPRSFIGWGAACGFTARALNYCGRFSEAKALCEFALSHLTAADRPFVTLFLDVELELAGAEAALGDVAKGQARMLEISNYHAASDNPLTRGRIHEAYVRISARAGDWTTFREHLDAMRGWYNRTGTAALIARVERLRALDPIQSNRPGARANAATITASERSPQNPADNDNAAVTICTVTEVTNSDPKAPSGGQTKR